ncbi:MAG: excinuclease ABC subunit UvrA [Ferruginibacter sp.]
MTKRTHEEPVVFEKKGSGFINIRGGRQHNLKNVSLQIPRDSLVVFTGVSGSGKSSLAFGTLYAEAQRRYLESVSPYARRLFNQMQVPEVDSIVGLPPAVALQQQRGAVSTRSSVGSVTTLSNLIRMLFSRAGDYPKAQPVIYAEGFSPNTPEGACTECHGLGRVYEVTEQSMVPDDSLSIRERAIAAWPAAWHGQNLREILITLGYDIDKPWRDLPRKQRDWILFTEEQPVVPVFSGWNSKEVKDAIKRKIKPSYMGTFTGVRKYVLQTFSHSPSPLMKKRVARYMLGAVCPVCLGKKLKKAALSVKFAGYDIADLGSLPLAKLAEIITPYNSPSANKTEKENAEHPEKQIVIKRIASDLLLRLQVMLDLGLGYLSVERTTPTLSPGELQRLRLATQVCSNLFGVVYVLDEPSAGLHPADTEALLSAFDGLKAAGNSVFVVEHELDVIKHADWIVDVGPGAGEAGGYIVYSGPTQGLRSIAASKTKDYLFASGESLPAQSRTAKQFLSLTDITRNNIESMSVDFPIAVLTVVTGISGSGKSTLISQVLVQLVADALGHKQEQEEVLDPLADPEPVTLDGKIKSGMQFIKRLVQVDQKPIGRTPRSNLATYTGLFDHVRKLFAATKMAKARHYDAGRFSFNVSKGRCDNCQGEGFVMIELLFLPSVYAPCPVCHGSRYNYETLEIKYKGRNIAEVLAMTVREAAVFFEDDAVVKRSLDVLEEVGLGYLRLGQPATELSGGEAQRIKLATELQRAGYGNTLYVLDEPTTGLHPADVEKLMIQLNRLVDAGNTVILVEHDMHVIAKADWIIDIGPGAGDEGGKIVTQGTVRSVLNDSQSKTVKYLKKFIHKLP